MRVPLSWLRDYVDLPSGVAARDVADRLTAAGLQVERVDRYGDDIRGVMVARVLHIEDLTGFKKPVRWVTLSDGSTDHQVICGATNFAVNDLVAYARPPATLPGEFTIEARQAYGHTSDGMICSGRELGLSDDHAGILVLADDLTLGADVVDALGLRDEVLDISLNPDRGYALSIRGVAREVATAYAIDFRDPAVIDVPAASGSGYEVRIDAADGCDRYLARVITGLDPAATSPQWLQRRLTLAGMRPVSLMVDVTNHVMLDVGQPLHAFDHAKLLGPIVVRRATVGERLRTLDGVNRTLDPRDLLIADDSGPIALGGVMGGEATEIGKTTTAVVIEAAHFEATTVTYTARRHRLASEASRRFERGVDDALPPAAADIAAELLARLAGGRPDDGVTDVDLRPAPWLVALDVSLPGRIAGLEYSPDTVAARLRDVGCVVTGEDRLSVRPPPWRPDLRLPVDLVEEVVRLEGYDALPSTVPRAPVGRGLTRPQRLRRQVGRALADAGYAEVLTTPFVDAASAERLLLDPDDPRRPSVRVANPVSAEQPFLRPTLLPGLFDALARNVGRGLTDVALFETGPVFRRRADAAPAPRLVGGARPDAADLARLDAALPDQPNRVAVVLAGMRERTGWWGPARPAGWQDAIEAARELGRTLGVDVTVAADRHAPFHPGRCASLHVANTLLGHAGELHPRVIEASGLPARTAAAELSLDVLLGAAPDVAAAPSVSAYPPATVDVAIVVAAEVPAQDVERALRDGAGELLESVRLFDLYLGDQVGPGSKSLAFTLRLRAPDRTLTADDVTMVRDAAVREAASRLGATLRTS